jgi:hypothetical protein
LLINSDYLLAAFVFGFSVLPVTAVFKCPAGWPRQAMATYSLVIIGAGLLGLGALYLEYFKPDPLAWVRKVEGPLLSTFLFGILLSGWVANFLISQRVKK